MPLFMDVHERLPQGATAKKDVAEAHAADVRTQDQYGVNYLKYWVDGGGKVFCLVRRQLRRFPLCESEPTAKGEAGSGSVGGLACGCLEPD
jgi:hypothetical protein